MDLIHSTALVVESVLDQHGAGVVAQSDIAGYFDNVRWLHMYRRLRVIGVPEAVCCAVACLHCLPTVSLEVAGLVVFVLPRMIGLQTGSSSANQLQRVPVYEVWGSILPRALPLSFQFGGDRVLGGSGADNNVFYGLSPFAAVQIADMFEERLGGLWQLEICANSREVLAIECMNDRYAIVSSFKPLSMEGSSVANP